MLSVISGGTYDERRTHYATDSDATGRDGAGLTRQLERTVECLRNPGVSVQGPAPAEEAWAVLSTEFYRGGEEFDAVHPEEGCGRGAAADHAVSLVQNLDDGLGPSLPGASADPGFSESVVKGVIPEVFAGCKKNA